MNQNGLELKQSLTRLISWCGLSLGLGLAMTLPSHAQKKPEPPKARVYFDAKNNRYFTAKQTVFEIRDRGSLRRNEPLQFRINRGSFQPFQGQIEFSGEGLNIVEFRSPDPTLKWSPIQKFRFFVDQTPPESEVLFEGESIEKNGFTFIHPSTQFRIVSQDRLSGVKQTYWRFGKKARIFPGKAQFKKPGKYRFEFASIDQVDNQETWKTVQFVVDHTPPVSKPEVIGESSQKKNYLYLSTGSLVGLESTDVDSGVKKIEYQINKSPVETYKQPIAINAGRTILKYRAIDAVGNQEEWKTFVVFADNRAPDLRIGRIGSNVITQGKFYARPGFKIMPIATDQESGIQKVEYHTGDEQWKRFQGEPLEFKQSGQYRVRFRAQDGVANQTLSELFEIIIDDQEPKTQFMTKNKIQSSGDAFQTEIPNTIRFLAEDSGVGVDHIEYSFDKRKFFKFKDPIDLAKWQNSQRTLYYRAIDRLGNKEPLREINVLIKKMIPQADLYVETKNYPNVPLSRILRSPASKGGRKR